MDEIGDRSGLHKGKHRRTTCHCLQCRQQTDRWTLLRCQSRALFDAQGGDDSNSCLCGVYSGFRGLNARRHRRALHAEPIAFVAFACSGRVEVGCTRGCRFPVSARSCQSCAFVTDRLCDRRDPRRRKERQRGQTQSQAALSPGVGSILPNDPSYPTRSFAASNRACSIHRSRAARPAKAPSCASTAAMSASVQAAI